MEPSYNYQPEYQPLLLLPNVSYPAYQLYAEAGRGKTPGDTVLTIAVLETMQWLRQRFRAFDIPPEIDWPDASQYERVDLNSFGSFHISVGYKVEVIWLPNERIWTLQLTEPDLGTRPGVPDEGRPPVPGRIFETNIAYRIFGDRVECGFRTIVSEPVGTGEPCEVFRLAFIKNLARSPIVGLWQGWPLLDTPHTLDTVSAIRMLRNWLRDRSRMMPAVVIAECGPKDVSSAGLPSLPEPGLLTQLRRIPMLDENLPWTQKGREQPFDITQLARYRMGYAQFFTLPAARIGDFRKITGQAIDAGDILVLEPLAFGGESSSNAWGRIELNPERVRRRLDDYIQNYPKNKPMQFGSVVFLPEAKQIDREKALGLSHSREELLRAFEKKLQAVEERHAAKMSDMEMKCAEKDERIQSLYEETEQLDKKLSNMNQNCIRRLAEAEEKSRAIISAKDDEIEWLWTRLDRPKRQEEIIEWGERHFRGKLLFYERARNQMDALSPNSVNVELLCDALSYLATEYRDNLLGIIDDNEMKLRCNRRYGRPFGVTPV
ncbi:MAG: TMF family protein, partial [Clostridiales bacterium]|nr:TMF family protein [Clostridiales bacterium]